MMLGVLEELEMEDMEESDMDMDFQLSLVSETSKAQYQNKSINIIDRAFEVRKRNVIRQALLANISCSIIHEIK